MWNKENDEYYIRLIKGITSLEELRTKYHTMNEDEECKRLSHKIEGIQIALDWYITMKTDGII
jgi:hypothetical protein